MVDWLAERLLAVPLPPQARSAALALLDSGPDRERRLKDVVHLLCVLPEFHLA